MIAMPGEKLLLESDSGDLLLSTHRIRSEKRRWGKVEVKSIMLEELCSCEITYNSYLLCLVLAGLFVLSAAIAGYLTQRVDAVIGLLLVACVLTVVYFSTRRLVVSFTSGGATITVAVKQLKLDHAHEFLEEVEAAKNRRSALIMQGQSANASG